MTESLSGPAAFSSPQRRCHLLLLLYLPTSVTLDLVCQLNGVDPAVARQDIAEVAAEIQRYHRLAVVQPASESFAIEGAELDRQLCLLHWLRRALRLTPDFVRQQFSPAIKQQLQRLQMEKLLYDEHNLSALIQHCSQGLARDFTDRDRQFLPLFMQYVLCCRAELAFNESQQAWLSARAEFRVAQEIVNHWQKRCKNAPDSSVACLLALLFSQIHAPVVADIRFDYQRQLHEEVHLLIERFQMLSGHFFSNPDELGEQLYTHLAQALERCLFGIGIDNSLSDEVVQLYPRLLRTTKEAIVNFEQHYGLAFSQEEMGLIAIIFGAWLMQENVLQEKQVLLLTGKDRELEKQVEQQLRELTLLPLSIKYLDVIEYQRSSAPKGIALVITPYATPLPLYSPPLIHAELPLQSHQQERIRLLLES
ncbi:stationary phase inducible protein CsiE [Erwinia sp. BNK-24-b]|uniref:stationary phase inducible protein CsiE n=1 Tax=Erwinia TaxID=551 RepID=UPI001FEF76E7|nr:stationary phase inducible protein CsiE [Erwinia phyllosphaerae]MBV4367949.1 stationary phase inducible protein CsiE [Erwinia phyllosphaerae]